MWIKMTSEIQNLIWGIQISACLSRKLCLGIPREACLAQDFRQVASGVQNSRGDITRYVF